MTCLSRMIVCVGCAGWQSERHPTVCSRHKPVPSIRNPPSTELQKLGGCRRLPTPGTACRKKAPNPQVGFVPARKTKLTLHQSLSCMLPIQVSRAFIPNETIAEPRRDGGKFELKNPDSKNSPYTKLSLPAPQILQILHLGFSTTSTAQHNSRARKSIFYPRIWSWYDSVLKSCKWFYYSILITFLN